MKIYKNGYRYDAMFHGDSDIEFIKTETGKTKGPLLELCCGTGRLLLPLLEAGFECTGIDYSPEMISVANEKISKEGYKADLIEADASSFDLGKKFSSIIMCLNSIGHFTTYKQITGMLNCVSGHLTSNGIFIIDVFVPSMRLLVDRDDEVMQFKYTDPESKETIELWESYSYDTATQIKTAYWRSVKDGETRIKEELKIKMFFPQELDALLKLNGFEIIEKYGNYDYSVFSNKSPKQLVICKRKA